MELLNNRCCSSPHLSHGMYYATDCHSMNTQCSCDIVVIVLHEIQVFNQHSHECQAWITLSDDRKYTNIQYPLIVLLGTLCPRAIDFSCHLFCNTISDADRNMSLQVVSVVFLMIIKITSPVIAFHRSHCKGWKHFSGAIANCHISENEIWSGHNGMTMIGVLLFH